MGSAASAPGAPSERLSIDEARALLPDGRAWRDSWDLRFTSVGIAEPKTVGRATALRVWAKEERASKRFEVEVRACPAAPAADAADAARPAVAPGAFDFEALIAEKAGQHLAGTREWVFAGVPGWKNSVDDARS